jgi:hypothetical protein
VHHRRGQGDLEKNSRRLDLNRSAFVELAIRAKARQMDQQYALLKSHQ